MTTLTFIDETVAGNTLQQWDVAVETNTLTLRELIMLRVDEEIRRIKNERIERYFTGIADAPAVERLLNRKSPPRKLQEPDPEAHGYRALDAFRKNAFFVLVDNRQVDDLEEAIALRPDTTISFVRLTPLVGG